MGKIVAVGGGEIATGETLDIDKYIVALANRKMPKLLFLPTASNDAAPYIDFVEQYFGKLGCEVSTLCLVSQTNSEQTIKRMISDADIVYVGGGNTAKMLQIWKQYRVDQYLKEAYQNGAVLSGLSAGAICWFVSGDSDSLQNSQTMSGLGLIPAVCCPHYNQPEKNSFDTKIKNQPLAGIALEDGTAFVENDGIYTVVKSLPQNKAYFLQCKNGVFLKEELQPLQEYRLDTTDG